MKMFSALVIGFLLALFSAQAAPLTPGQQKQIDARAQAIAKWAALPVLVKAVRAANEKGPLPNMTNASWSALQPGDPVVQAFEKGPAGLWLAKRIEDSDGLFCEAFLCGAKGQKVAFASKPTSYIHAGSAKFDVPMSGKPWQGLPDRDASTGIYAVQISTPVLDGGKPIGVLVVGISVDKLGAKKKK